MKIKRDIANMLESLMGTMREGKKDKYRPNDRPPDSTNPAIYFPVYPAKRTMFVGKLRE